MLIQIEQQNKKIKELEDKLNEKVLANSDDNSYLVFLQKRIDELIADSKRHSEQYKTLHNDFLALMAKVKNEKSQKVNEGIVLNGLKKYQQMVQLQNSAEQKLYESRVIELEKMAEEFTTKKQKYEERIKNLEEKLEQKQEQEVKIEGYVNKLLQNYKEAKNDIITILNSHKEVMPKEYYTKYIN